MAERDVEGVWETEDEAQEELGYKVKAHLILEGSEKHEWGVVKDCHGCINHIPEDAEIVGTWAKYSDGAFWVSLETSLQALQDRATLLTAELARRRAQEPAVRKAAVPRAKRVMREAVQEDVSSVLDKLRSQIKAG